MTDTLSPEVEREIEDVVYDLIYPRATKQRVNDALRAQRLAGRKDVERCEHCGSTAVVCAEGYTEANSAWMQEAKKHADAADALRAQVETLTRERDEARMQRNAACDREDANRVRAEAAEARVKGTGGTMKRSRRMLSQGIRIYWPDGFKANYNHAQGMEVIRLAGSCEFEIKAIGTEEGAAVVHFAYRQPRGE